LTESIIFKVSRGEMIALSKKTKR